MVCQKINFLLIKIGRILIHSHRTTVVVLAIVIPLFDDLREKRSVSLTEWSGVACLKNSCSARVENHWPSLFILWYRWGHQDTLSGSTLLMLQAGSVFAEPTPTGLLGAGVVWRRPEGRVAGGSLVPVGMTEPSTGALASSAPRKHLPSF